MKKGFSILTNSMNILKFPCTCKYLKINAFFCEPRHCPGIVDAGTWNFSINKGEIGIFHTHLLINMPTKKNKNETVQFMRTNIKYY